ncbi:MAG: terminase family protein [Methyloceanibacter sp.]|nr:terminase family protein [Methyloceanibacter sp.]
MWARALPPRALAKWLSSLSDEEAQALLYDWSFQAREAQLPPDGDWFVWMLRSGRGFGKTRTGAEWVISRAKSEQFQRIALVGQTKADVRDTMVEVGDSSIMRISPPWFRPVYEPSKRRLTWPNGCIGIIYSGDEPDQLRGPQHDTAWCDELAKFRYAEETWSNLTLGLRVGPKPQICITTTPRPIPLLRRLMKSPTTRDVQRPTDDNIQNLSPVYIREVIDPMRGTRLGRQEIEAQLLEDTPGALWTLQTLDALRVKAAPDLARVVVAVDPEATSGERSAETGIIVGGIGTDGHGYILDDDSVRGRPLEWASTAVKAYHAHKADRLVAETNQGGEMVEQTVHTVDSTVAYRGVHASRGKQARAEPVAALYEQGRVHHVGTFPELEDQLCTWVPGGKSPDRLDALVWAMTDLMFKPVVGSVPNPFYDS